MRIRHNEIPQSVREQMRDTLFPLGRREDENYDSVFKRVQELVPQMVGTHRKFKLSNQTTIAGQCTETELVGWYQDGRHVVAVIRVVLVSKGGTEHEYFVITRSL